MNDRSTFVLDPTTSRQAGMFVPPADLLADLEVPDLSLEQYHSVPFAQLEQSALTALCNQLFEPDERFCQGYYRYWRYILNQSKEEAWQNALTECDETLTHLLQNLQDPYMHTVGFVPQEETYVPVGIFGFRELSLHPQGQKLYATLEQKRLLNEYEGPLAIAHTYSSLKKYRNLFMLKYAFLHVGLQALERGFKHIFFFMSDFRLGTIYTRFGLEFPEHLSFQDSCHLVGCYSLTDYNVEQILATAREFGVDTTTLSKTAPTTSNTALIH